MYLDERIEELFLRYINPEEYITPGEIHALARGLLGSIQSFLRKHKKKSLSFYEALNELLNRYHDFLIQLPDRERRGVFKWWRENLGPISAIQGIVTLYTLMAGGVFKILIAVTYKGHEWWTRRSARKYIERLERNLRELSYERKAIPLTKAMPDPEEFLIDLTQENVLDSDPEVTELADTLLEIRRRVYGH